MAEAEADIGAAGASALLDLSEPLLLHILGFLTDLRSRHDASMACRRMLAAKGAATSLRGDSRTPDFLLLPTPGFCFPVTEGLDLSLASPWSRSATQRRKSGGSGEEMNRSCEEGDSGTWD
ncbi:hypothetical protein ZWY2020_009760 [Hordeum vulgare]|nr:hypothetical protein ZWY2020_009760 [Hordeum vulgare]